MYTDQQSNLNRTWGQGECNSNMRYALRVWHDDSSPRTSLDPGPLTTFSIEKQQKLGRHRDNSRATSTFLFTSRSFTKNTVTGTDSLIRCRDNLSPTLWTWITSRSRREAAEAVAVEVEVVEATSKATHMVVDLPQRQ